MVSKEEVVDEIRKKVVVVGDGGCGKTCLLISYVDKKMPSGYIPTIFETYIADLSIDNIPFELSLYDTAGQDAYDRLRPLSYPDTDVLIVCFSADSPDSLYNAFDKWVPEVRHFCPSTPLILVCNKVDLRDDEEVIKNLAKIKQYPVTNKEGKELAERIHAAAYIECSSLTRFNVEEVFEVAARTTLKKRNKRLNKIKQIRCNFL